MFVAWYAHVYSCNCCCFTDLHVKEPFGSEASKHIRERGTLHNVLFLQQDSPVLKIALYMIQGDDKIPRYLDKNWGIKCQNHLVDTGVLFRENNKFRV